MNDETSEVKPELERMSATLEVVEFCQRHGLPADVVGRWVWIQFIEKPAQATRTLLKANGFKWCKKRGEWAHCGGVPSRHGPGNPRFKYGSVPVSQIETEAA